MSTTETLQAPGNAGQNKSPRQTNAEQKNDLAAPVTSSTPGRSKPNVGQAGASGSKETQAVAKLKGNEPPAVPEQKFDFVDWGPPPDIRQRELIFDSLKRIVNSNPSKFRTGKEATDNRGTYTFTWGAGYHSQLGRKFERGQKKYTPVPMPVPLDVVVRHIACGSLHTAIVTETGQIWTWGDGRKGELGHDHNPMTKQTPGVIELQVTDKDLHVKPLHAFFTAVACGGHHTAAITDTGELYTWGWSKYFQTGHGDRTNYHYPRKVENALAKDIIDIACGGKHTVAINKAGVAMSFGCGKHGQTGQGQDDDTMEPTRIETLGDKKITSIACGSIHSCFISEGGEVFLCGFGEHIMPGDSKQHFFYTPHTIKLPEPMKQVACGQSHILVLSTKGNVYAWGAGDYGQIGHGIRANTSVPRLVIENKNVAQVAAGRYHSMAVTNAGLLYSWGCGENGQLGLGYDKENAILDTVTLPTVVTPILGTVVGHVACGEHHTAILTSAPWSKASHDVKDWLEANKEEFSYKQKLIFESKRPGLSREDFAKLRKHMRDWQTLYESEKKKVAEMDHERTKRDISEIQYEAALQESVKSKMVDQKLPEIPPAVIELPSERKTSRREEKEEEKDDEEDDGIRLPYINKGKQRAGFGPVSARTDSAQVVTRSIPDPAREATPDYGPTMSVREAPVARQAFLKDTAAMVKRMTMTFQNKGEVYGQDDINNLSRQVFRLRKEYDQLKSQVRERSKALGTVKRSIDLVSRNHKSGMETNEQASERLEALKMQLNTVTIKIAETAENRKNYELQIAHLKEEEYDHQNQLKALRTQSTDNTGLRRMMQQHQLALVEKERAESELTQFKKDIASYHTFINSQLNEFDGILGIVRNHNEKREVARSLQTDAAREKIQDKLDKLSAEAETAEQEAKGLRESVVQLDQKLRQHEEKFQKIAAATGLTDADAIINKFFFKGEIKDQLQAEIEEKKKKLQEKGEELVKLNAELDLTKNSHRDQTWRDVEHLSEHNRELDARADQSLKDMERLVTQLTFVQEGLMSLTKQVEAVTEGGKEVKDENLPDNVSLWTPAQSLFMFQRLSDSYDKLLVKIAEAEKEKVSMQAERAVKAAQDKQAADAEAKRKAAERPDTSGSGELKESKAKYAAANAAASPAVETKAEIKAEVKTESTTPAAAEQPKATETKQPESSGSAPAAKTDSAQAQASDAGNNNKAPSRTSSATTAPSRTTSATAAPNTNTNSTSNTNQAPSRTASSTTAPNSETPASAEAPKASSP